MRLDMNPRGNGACPLCRLLPRCPLRKALAESLEEFRDPEETGMEIVIYTCPMFKENY
jgi:hypothetical protein